MNELEKLLKKYPDKPWNWEWISRNPNITIDIINQNPDKPWNWDLISNNGFLYEFERYKDKPCYRNFPYIINRRNKNIDKYRNTLPFIYDLECIVLDYSIDY